MSALLVFATLSAALNVLLLWRLGHAALDLDEIKGRQLELLMRMASGAPEPATPATAPVAERKTSEVLTRSVERATRGSVAYDAVLEDFDRLVADEKKKGGPR